MLFSSTFKTQKISLFRRSFFLNDAAQNSLLNEAYEVKVAMYAPTSKARQTNCTAKKKGRREADTKTQKAAVQTQIIKFIFLAQTYKGLRFKSRRGGIPYFFEWKKGTK